MEKASGAAAHNAYFSALQQSIAEKNYKEDVQGLH